MDTNIKFKAICAGYEGKDSVVIHLENDHYNDYDCVDTCIIWTSIPFYGIPFSLENDDKMERVYRHDYRGLTKIGTLAGCLILCEQIIVEGYDPLEVCDASSADLEHVISALSDIEGPLNEETGDPYRNVFYIHELEMESGWDDAELKAKIIKQLPWLILSFHHVMPDILAFYPAPLAHAPNTAEEERYKILQQIAAQKIERALTPEAKKPLGKGEDNLLSFAEFYQFNEDDMKFVTRRRYSGSTYPETAKDLQEYIFYEANGFEELGDSRLLFKVVDDF